MVAADARTAITFLLSPGQAHDAPAGRELLFQMVLPFEPVALIMDRAYEGDETRELATRLGYVPIVPPKETRVNPWEYDRALYRRRTKSSGFSDGSRAFVASSHASKSSMSCSWDSFTSRSSPKAYAGLCVNTP